MFASRLCDIVLAQLVLGPQTYLRADLLKYNFEDEINQTDILHSACFTGGGLTRERTGRLALRGRKVTGT